MDVVLHSNTQKIILTDVDGVLLDWEEGFTQWMLHNGYTPVPNHKCMYNIGQQYNISKAEGSELVRTFNQSAAIGQLLPLRDSQHYVKLLTEVHEYKFLAVTSLSTEPQAKQLRTHNLEKLFGANTFVEIICLDTGADKDQILLDLAKFHKGNWWIEDKAENVTAGIAAGFNSILVQHEHNLHYCGTATVVKTWKDIYNMVIDREKASHNDSN